MTWSRRPIGPRRPANCVSCYSIFWKNDKCGKRIWKRSCWRSSPGRDADFGKLAFSLKPDDVKKMGYTDDRVREIIAGKKLLPAEIKRRLQRRGPSEYRNLGPNARRKRWARGASPFGGMTVGTKLRHGAGLPERHHYRQREPRRNGRPAPRDPRRRRPRVAASA